MLENKISRRDSFFLIGTGAALAASGFNTIAGRVAYPPQSPAKPGGRVPRSRLTASGG